MKKKTTKLLTVVLAVLLFSGTLAFVGCSKKLADAPLNATVISDFTKTAADRAETFESSGWENGDPFNAWWKASNVSFDNNQMTLSIADMPVKEKVTNAAGETVDCLSDYYGGEERSSHYYGYGDFKVKMKPSKVLGTASAFFTCTGPYDKWYNKDGEVVKENDHDEIDIEFLGKDTTKVQFNYFASGIGGHEYMYDLGFDAAAEFHEYGFRWTKDNITWFVDNKPVYKVERSKIKKGEEWPEEPGRIIMNHWVGTEKASAWMGAFADDFSGHADYLYAASSATAQNDPITTKPDNEPQPGEPIPTDIAWDETLFVPFVSAESIYTVTADEANKKNTVTYTKVEKNSWKNVGTPIAAPGRNHFGITLTGKTDKPANVRINLLDAEVKHLVKKSYVNVGTTSISDGAFVTVPANGSVDVAIYYEGTLAAIELMIDSTNLATDDANANTVELSNTKFGVKGDVIESEPSKNEGVKIGDNNVKFAGSPYTVETAADSSTMTVKYADLPGKGYSSIVGDVSSFIGTSYNSFTFKITNNGAQTAKLRVDIDCTAGLGTPDKDNKGNAFCNTSATVTGALENGNDYEYNGGDWLKLAAGATATVTVRFTTGVGANGIRFFIDSSSYDDLTTHTGEVMFSEMKFETVA